MSETVVGKVGSLGGSVRVRALDQLFINNQLFITVISCCRSCHPEQLLAVHLTSHLHTQHHLLPSGLPSPLPARPLLMPNFVSSQAQGSVWKFILITYLLDILCNLYVYVEVEAKNVVTVK